MWDQPGKNNDIQSKSWHFGSLAFTLAGTELSFHWKLDPISFTSPANISWKVRAEPWRCNFEPQKRSSVRKNGSARYHSECCDIFAFFKSDSSATQRGWDDRNFLFSPLPWLTGYSLNIYFLLKMPARLTFRQRANSMGYGTALIFCIPGMTAVNDVS